MTDKEIKYSIGSGIVEKHEAAVLAELSTLYPDEREGQIVESVLLPQFRAQLAEVFDRFDQPLVPAQLPRLCKDVDKMLEGNKELLDLDGMFRPVMEWIQGIRDEVGKELKKQFYQRCKELLAEKGVRGKQELLKKGVTWFTNERFSPHGGGRAFAGKILERTVYVINIPLLEEIAGILELPRVSDNEKIEYIETLRAKGVTDLQTLLWKGTEWFKRGNFPPYGYGLAFAGRVLGEFLSWINTSTLKQIADTLGLPKLSEESKQTFRDALGDKGITDRQGLLEIGAVLFTRTEFPPFGKGIAFANRVLGDSLSGPATSHLERVADVLELPRLSEDNRQKFCEALEAEGITDRLGLLKGGAKWFKRTNFPPYGKGCALAGKILGETVGKMTVPVLEQITDTLELPKLSESSKQKFRKILETKGITCRHELLGRGPIWFRAEEFSPYGKGHVFAGKILGKLSGMVTIPVLEQIADVLFPVEEN